MKITLEVSEKDECTDSPWWIIIDPRQIMRTDKEACYAIASMITGPFFSREDAQNYLDGRRYAFGKNAVVYCHRGYHSEQYKKAIREAQECKKNQ